MEKTAVNKLILLFLFLYFVIHLSIMHYNQHQMSKLDIKGKKGYAIMTFITVYFFYLVVVPSLWLSYKNKVQVADFMMVVGFILIISYFGYSLSFTRKNLIKGVSEAQDKQRKFCIANIVLTLLGFFIFIIIFIIRKSLQEHEEDLAILKQKLTEEINDTLLKYNHRIDQWYDKIKDIREFWDISEIYEEYFKIRSVFVDKNDLSYLRSKWMERFNQQTFRGIEESLRELCDGEEGSKKTDYQCDEKLKLIREILNNVQTWHNNPTMPYKRS